MIAFSGEAFLVSASVVALAEIGDKTQLLALILAARFKRPWPIIAGMFVATVINHTLAGAVGAWITQLVGPERLRWILGASFVAMGVWILVPDRVEDDEARERPTYGVFATTLVAFFLAEMGDKTQIATVALAAKYASYVAVVAGTTLGMMLADAPVALFGERVARALPIRLVHGVCALIFVAIGALTAFGAAGI